MKHRILPALSFAALLALSPAAVNAAEQCSFSGVLELGSTSESVRCLQRYLNENGFTVASSGVGSRGNETSLYREKTKDAVRRWQIANGISPATGNFGPLSQARYATLISESGYVPAPTPTPNPVPETPAEETINGKKNAAARDLRAAKAAYDDAYKAFQNAEKDDRKTGSAEDYLEDALKDLFRGYEAYLEDDFADARNYAINSSEASDEAESQIADNDDDDDDRSDKERARDAIESAREDLDDARDEVEEAEDDDRDTGDADDLLDEAEEKIDEAEEAYDDKDYADVDDYLDEADDLIDEAMDEIED